MAKIQKKDGSLVIKKSFWSAISIWWEVLIFLIAIPTVLIVLYVMLDYIPYMDALKQYAEANGITGVSEAIYNDYKAAVEAGSLMSFENAVKAGKAESAGLLGLASMLVVKMNLSYSMLELVKIAALVVGGIIFLVTLIVLIVKFICVKKTSWTFYDGAVIYKKGRVFYSENITRDMEFFPGMSVSVRRTLKGKLFGYGDVVLSNGAGEAGEIVMTGAKRPRKVQKLLRKLLAIACTRTANMMSPYKMYPQMYRHVLGGYPSYYYGAMQMQNAQKPKK